MERICLHRGQLASIWRYKKDEFDIAVKKFKKKKDFRKERKLLKVLAHEFVVNLLPNSFQQESWLCIELANGSLADVISGDLEMPRLSFLQKKSMIIKVASAMTHIHEKNFVHFDLKSSNILIFNKTDGGFPILKVSDFGSCWSIEDLRKENVHCEILTTPVITAPEILTVPNHCLNGKVDVFAFGVVLWEFFHEQEIFDGLSSLQVLQNISTGNMPSIVKSTNPLISRLLNNCWKTNSNERITFAAILEYGKNSTDS